MWGYLGLTTAFVLLATVLLWILITSKANVIVKAILIFLVMYYGIILYYTPANLMGWPQQVESMELMPDNSWVSSTLIKEPDKVKKTPGAIFFIVVGQEDGIKISLNPKNAFAYRGSGKPRMYELPYTRELHKEILKKQRKQGNSPGSRMLIRRGVQARGQYSNQKSQGKMTIEILNPFELLEKPGQ